MFSITVSETSALECLTPVFRTYRNTGHHMGRRAQDRKAGYPMQAWGREGRARNNLILLKDMGPDVYFLKVSTTSQPPTKLKILLK